MNAVLFAEGQARLLLVAHTVLAAALVAVSTHLVVWMRGFPRARYTRLRGVRKLATISAVLFTLTFVVGNLIYPVYKVRVRAEYLDHPSALMRDQEERLEARARVEARYRDLSGTPGTPGTPSPDMPLDEPGMDENLAPSDAQVTRESIEVPRAAAKIARWFDTKEHWVAFGMLMAIGCAVLLMRWKADAERNVIASLVFMMAVAAAASAWFGALVGVIVTSYRAVGGG